MKILCNDIGTGTQDIFLFDSRQNMENGFKLVLPSPTMIVNRKLIAAAHDGCSVLLTGVNMGGGPSQWGAEEIIRGGGKVFATPAAARTFNDDLEKVAEAGITIVSEDEGDGLAEDVIKVEMRDFDFKSIREAFELFGVDLDDLDAVAVAVFDHGAAPSNVSDRKFRFDYLDDRIQQENRLSAFAYSPENIPPSMTRLQAVAASARDIPIPLVVMDTAPAAILGASYDPEVRNLPRKIIANIGNFHTLAFRLGSNGIEGLFEHHTGLIDRMKVEGYIEALANGSLTNSQVFDDHGHGALLYSDEKYVIPQEPFGVVVTGPRRSLMAGYRLQPYFPAPFGDMMITGCFGLLSAVGDVIPEWKDEIEHSLNDQTSLNTAPWDLN
jgi:uncharacterized protein (DUF1786 family)